MSKSNEIHLSIPGREELWLDLVLGEAGQIMEARLRGVGPWAFLELLQKTRAQLKGALKEVPLPRDKSPGGLLLREALLRARGEWNPPYQEPELCHCRAVLTEVVDRAILVGAHTPQKVTEQTSASTACGTCRPNVAAMIQYRLAEDF
jgi:bacterioferritin-associated ferredoxin